MATTTPQPCRTRRLARALPRLPPAAADAGGARAGARRHPADVGCAMDEEGDSSAELQALFTQLKALLDEIDSRITRQATIDDLDRRASANPLGGTDDATIRIASAREFSITRAIAAQLHNPGIDAGREREVSAELARPINKGATSKAFRFSCARCRTTARCAQRHGSACGGATGYQQHHTSRRAWRRTHPPGARSDAVYRRAAAGDGGARDGRAAAVLDLRANLDLPRMSGATSTAGFAENTAIPTSDETLRPRERCGRAMPVRSLLCRATCFQQSHAQTLKPSCATTSPRCWHVPWTVRHWSGPRTMPAQPQGIIYIAGRYAGGRRRAGL